MLRFVLVAALAACSSHYDTVLGPDVERWGEEIKESASKLSEDEKGLLMRYTLRVALGAETVPTKGIKIRDALKAEESFERIQKRAEEEEAARLAAKSAALDAAVSGKATYFVFLEKPKNRYNPFREGTFVVKVFFKNKADRPIKAVNGDIIIRDNFGEVIDTFTTPIEGDFHAGKEYDWTGEVPFNEFLTTHNRLTQGNLDYAWKPTIVVFADGSRIEVQ